MNSLELVIFDMDGLMFDTERTYCNATCDVMERLHIEVDMQALYDAIGSSYFDVERFFVHGVPEGVDGNRLLTDSVNWAVDDMCRYGVPKKSGLDELLTTLHKKGIRMVVATSTPISRARRLLECAKVWSNFEFVITGEEVERGKPHPDIFLEACKRAGTPPQRALVLEDSINGGLAAKAAGIPYIIVPDMKPPTAEVAASAQAIVHSLYDVLAFL